MEINLQVHVGPCCAGATFQWEMYLWNYLGKLKLVTPVRHYNALGLNIILLDKYIQLRLEIYTQPLDITTIHLKVCPHGLLGQSHYTLYSPQPIIMFLTIGIN